MTTVYGKRVVLKSKEGEYLIPYIDDGNNLANIDFSNLSTIAEKRLHALKGYLDEGELIVDSKLYGDVHYYAHSTFDSSKFSINGDLTISSEGLVSGFIFTNDTKNYIKDVPFGVANKSWRMEFSYVVDSTIPSTNPYILYNSKFNIQASPTNVFANLNNTQYSIAFGVNLVAGDRIDTVFEYNKTTNKSVFIAYLNGVQKGEVTKTGYNITTANLTLSLGCRPELNTSYASMCSIDLKKFSLRIDGEPVFLGNKTGTDVISIGGSVISIPFIESKTGSKVVDIFYKDRVEDVYEANGSALYYILDEFNGVAVLPMGELYGMISTYGGSGTTTENKRNVGEIVSSTIPLRDAGLHLLDGEKLYSGGVYDDFVNFIANLYDTDSTANYFMQDNIITKYGSLTDTNNIISGFSSTNYAVLIDTDYRFSPGNNTWEAVFKITTGADVATNQYICSSNMISTSQYGSFDILITNSKFCVNIGHDGSSSTSTSGTYTVRANTNYWVKLVYDGSKYIVSYSTTGTSYTTDITVNDSYPILQDTYILLGVDHDDATNLEPFLGSIDLNSSYIRISGSIWWSSNITPEDKWQYCVNSYGSCGKFVYDPVNTTVILPKITGFIEGSINPGDLGNLVKAGIPNLTGSLSDSTIQSQTTSNKSASGVFSITKTGTGNASGGSPAYSLTFDASRSSHIYRDGIDTVQPQSTLVLYYIVVANSTKIDIEVDIDNIITDLNSKVSTNDIWYDSITSTLYIGVS